MLSREDRKYRKGLRKRKRDRIDLKHLDFLLLHDHQQQTYSAALNLRSSDSASRDCAVLSTPYQICWVCLLIREFELQDVKKIKYESYQVTMMKYNNRTVYKGIIAIIGYVQTLTAR